jgi:phosphate starvation-inducible PhoH-like protein
LELTISLPYGDQRHGVVGAAERNLKIIRETLGVNVAARNGTVRISGDDEAVNQAASVLEQLSHAARRGKPADRRQLLDLIAMIGQQPTRSPRPYPARNDDMNMSDLTRPRPVMPNPLAGHQVDGPDSESLDVYLTGRTVRALTEGQKAYIEALSQHDLTFCMGPAGTGKTYLAVAAAVSMLKSGQVRKLVLVRPAVEAGEKLGFLPGNMQEKVNPYLRPLLDALHDMMEFEQIQRFMACDLIEIIPLAFMRGRTLNDSMIILDEAQNTTRSQMLMFLTRLGHGSKMAVTGDTSQIDLEDPRESGLIDAARRLRRVNGVAFVTLAASDIVRHSLVQRIVDCYGQAKDGPGVTPIMDDSGHPRPHHHRGEGHAV